MIRLLADVVVLAIYAGAVWAIAVACIPERAFDRICRACFPPSR